MAGYVMGLDAGATKSHLAVFTEEGIKVDLRAWGSLNHEALPGAYTQLETELKQFVGDTLKANGITFEQVRYSVFGVAGVDTSGQHALISDIFRRIGFKEFTLFNDGFLGIPAGCESAVGICAINGTGESIIGLNDSGRIFQIGAVGYISSDMGGGSYLGRRVVSAVYRSLFRKGEPTLLTDMLFKELGITSKYDFVETIYQKIDDGSYKVKELNKLLFKAAYLGDRIAIEGLRETALNYAGGIACMAEELDFPSDKPLNVILAGSVFVKEECPIQREMLSERVSELLPGREIRISQLKKPPVAGAVVWALKCLHGSGSYLDRVCDQL